MWTNDKELKALVNEVMAKAKNDEAFLTALVEADDPAALNNVLTERGFTLGDDVVAHMYKVFKDLDEGAEDELSEDDLESVSGGLEPITTWCILAGLTACAIKGWYDGLNEGKKKKKKKK